jgi:DNA polymerase V
MGERQFPQDTGLEATGFPSPAEDFYAGPVSLDRELIRNVATFIVRAGAAVRAEGIAAGDELIVDRSLTAQDGSLVIAVAGGELTVRRLRLPRLEAPGDGIEVWGVVTVVIHHV